MDILSQILWVMFHRCTGNALDMAIPDETVHEFVGWLVMGDDDAGA